MKVSRNGNLQDPQFEDGKKIIEAIYDILYVGWFSFMKEDFKGDHNEFLAIGIFSILIFEEPLEEELTELLYIKESEYSSKDASWSRCEKMASEIIRLRPWIDQNLAMTDDPNLTSLPPV